VERREEWLFLPSSHKVLAFPYKFDHMLLLYEYGVRILQMLFSFLREGFENDELCLFVHNDRTNNFYLKREFRGNIESRRLHTFPIATQGGKITFYEISNLNAKLQELYSLVPKNYSGLRVVMDFGSSVTSYVAKELINCLRKVCIRRSEKMPFATKSIIAFEINALPNNLMEALLKLYKNVILSTKSEYTILGLNLRSLGKAKFSLADTVSRKTLENFVKKNLEVIILSLLLKAPLCGYELIRRIYQEYHTFLSQGTVYPMLYTMQKQGFLKIVESKNPRSKVYALTEKGKEEAKNKIRDFIAALKYIMELLEKS
jgi:PadR family transcriptional regulator PadR